MNMAEKLEAIQAILCDEELCAEAMINKISEIVFSDEWPED